MSVGEGMRVFFEIDNVLTEMLSVRMAAYHYNFSVRTIRQWVDEDKIPSIEIEGRLWMKKNDLDRHVRRDFATQNVAELE